VTARFDAASRRLLKLAASDPRVERVFVHPLVKQALCTAAGPKPAWLQKIRPWWGHDAHFHARLACPEDSPECTAQAPLPPGDGCDALAWWLKQSIDSDREREQKAQAARADGSEGTARALPLACAAVALAAAAPPVPTRAHGRAARRR
jgi:penicillin-insensitive murein endopeptidase